MKRLLAIVILLAGCGSPGGGQTPTDAPGALAPATIATPRPTEGSAPTPSPTAIPRASALTGGCIVSAPAQFGLDTTPVIVEYRGATEAQCVGYLNPSPAPGASPEPPRTRLATAPTSEPACRVTAQGFTVTVWGSGAARFICASLQAAASARP